jgi:hypothetical protein
LQRLNEAWALQQIRRGKNIVPAENGSQLLDFDPSLPFLWNKTINVISGALAIVNYACSFRYFVTT